MTHSGAVFFDRDGVLIATEVIGGSPVASNQPNNVRFIDGAIEICEKLQAAGISTFLITNQPDISRGLVSADDVEQINHVVKSECHLTEIAVCPHDDRDMCMCRKPRPGMILDLAAQFRVSCAESVVVGDRWRDIEAGREAGCRTLFVDYGYTEKLMSEPTWKVHSMVEAGLILAKHFQL